MTSSQSFESMYSLTHTSRNKTVVNSTTLDPEKMKKSKEWTVECPWGKLAVVSWGDPKNTPILMFPGYLDTAATFLPLVECLPDKYYCVGVDPPGHGKSDPFPMGPMASHIHYVEAVRATVKYFNWKKFIFIGHSMGVMLGFYYNAIFPGQIACAISLDPGPALAAQGVSLSLPVGYTWMSNYYENYEKFKNATHRPTKYDDAINLMVRKRGITEEQAAQIMSRSLEPVGDGNYKMVLDPKMRTLSYLQGPNETMFYLMTFKDPILFNIIAEDNESDWNKIGIKIIQEVGNVNKNCFTIFLTGGHDLHVTNPADVAKSIAQFLEIDLNTAIVKSKL